MKKVFSLLFILVVIITSLFADKSHFYEDGKIIDNMYVNSEEGLRVRDKPGLIGTNKMLSLPHGVIVKVVSIGQEESIDDLSAPWVEILIPSYLWKSGKPEFGWVYGGYLSKERPTGTFHKLYGKDLERYLTSVESWAPDGLTQINFYSNYTFRYVTDKHYGMRPLEGKWEVNGNSLILYHSDKSDNEYLKVIGVEKGYFEVSGAKYVDNGKYYVNFYEAAEANNTLIDTETFYYLKDYNFVDSSFYMDYSKTGIVEKLIFRGFRPYGQVENPNLIQYMKKYRAYWNPIMEEHQKKADAMK